MYLTNTIMGPLYLSYYVSDLLDQDSTSAIFRQTTIQLQKVQSGHLQTYT